jgi:diguanylate cyclase (GGDEF)-like protein
MRAANSRYATELERGTISLRFPATLEREFRESHLDRNRSRVRVWQTALLVVGLLTMVFAMVMQGGLSFDLATGVRVLVLLPTCMVMTWFAWTRHYEDHYLRAALTGNVILAVAATSVAAHTISIGRPEALVFLSTNAMGVFFLSGLLFFDACLVNLLALFTFCVACATFGLPLPTMMYHTVVFAIVIAIGAFTSWGVEQTNRRFFLERGVLGDLAERDGLTGLRNRRSFDDHLLRVWQQSLRDRSAMAVLMIDLDYFKNYNDAYGHQAGDTCLTQVSQLVQRFARRPLDIAARYGGEELSVVLYQVTTEQATAIAEQIRDSVEKMRLEHRAAAGRGVVTVSIGVSWVEATFDRTPESLLQLADQALYSAKLAGRNAVRYLGPESLLTFDDKIRRLPTRA